MPNLTAPSKSDDLIQAESAETQAVVQSLYSALPYLAEQISATVIENIKKNFPTICQCHQQRTIHANEAITSAEAKPELGAVSAKRSEEELVLTAVLPTSKGVSSKIAQEDVRVHLEGNRKVPVVRPVKVWQKRFLVERRITPPKLKTPEIPIREQAQQNVEVEAVIQESPSPATKVTRARKRRLLDFDSSTTNSVKREKLKMTPESTPASLRKPAVPMSEPRSLRVKSTSRVFQRRVSTQPKITNQEIIEYLKEYCKD